MNVLRFTFAFLLAFSGVLQVSATYYCSALASGLYTVEIFNESIGARHTKPLVIE